jgi:TonB family protein
MITDVLRMRGLALAVASSVVGCAAPDTPVMTESLAQARARHPANQCEGSGKLAGVPVYPYHALGRRQSGWVIVTFDVEGGRPQRSKILASSPSGTFEATVLEFLRTARYEREVAGRGCVEVFQFKTS